MSQLDLVDVHLDRSGREPLSDQLAAAIEARIATGRLRSGDRLPTTRELASALQINRGTIQAAYRRLAAPPSRRRTRWQRHGRPIGRVAGRGRSTSRPCSRDGCAESAKSPRSRSRRPIVADFSRLTPDERFFPLEEFTQTLAAVWSGRKDLWQYAPPLGLPELREEIAAPPFRARGRAIGRRDPGHQRSAAGTGSSPADLHGSGRHDRGRIADLFGSPGPGAICGRSRRSPSRWVPRVRIRPPCSAGASRSST